MIKEATFCRMTNSINETDKNEKKMIAWYFYYIEYTATENDSLTFNEI